MIELIRAGGWMMWPIVLCSLLALAIVLERLWALRREQVLPQALINQLPVLAETGRSNMRDLAELRAHSPLGRVWAAVVAAYDASDDVRRERVEEAGRAAAHGLERYLNTLGTIAAISPLLGLLGTVAGMIQVFTAMTTHGLGDPQALSGGISHALLTTAAGLSVAIPALIAFRFLKGRVEERLLAIEAHTAELIDAQARARRELR